MAAGVVSCATTEPAVGRGGAVYSVVVSAIDGHPTSDRGILGREDGTIQVGDRVVRFWMAEAGSGGSSVALEADEAALRDGIVVEGAEPSLLEDAAMTPLRARPRPPVTVHRVTDEELRGGRAIVKLAYRAPVRDVIRTLELAFIPRQTPEP